MSRGNPIYTLESSYKMALVAKSDRDRYVCHGIADFEESARFVQADLRQIGVRRKSKLSAECADEVILA